MKRMFTLLLTSMILLSMSQNTTAQIKLDLKKKINTEVNKRVNKKTDEAVKKGLDKTEEEIKGALGGKNEDATKVDAARPAGAEGKPQTGVAGKEISDKSTATIKWAKYDFVPGDKVIFEDNLEGEENGEFPSRWDLVQGSVENAEFGEDKIIMFRGGSPTIVPYLKNPNIDYLPEVFTVEFDLFLPSNSFSVYFFDRKNQQVPRSATQLSVWTDRMEMSPASSMLPDKKSIAKTWAHISIAYTSGKLKAYIDDTRLINIPHLAFDPTGISFHVYHASDNNRSYIKNIRIAEGGVKYYDRFLQDGKIVSNGIRFDVGKASLRPESMGVLNEIYKMLSEHPDVAVSVEGHTDSDGDNDLNQKLSEDRAETVMKQLVSMGLSKDRLIFRGYGESRPIAPNDTPEGKASNRRVEFVKKSGSSPNKSVTPVVSQNTIQQKASNKSSDFKAVTTGSQGPELLSKVSKNDINGVKELIAKGADVNYQQDDMMGYTALGLTKDTVMMKVLIAAGADINHQDKRTGYTHLMNALNGNNTDLAGFLIRQGADINIKANDGATALILACGCSEKIAKQLLGKGADIHAITDRGMGVFTQCTGVGLRRETVSYEFAEFLLSKGADIDETNTTDYYGGYTPLFWAVEGNNEKLVSFLVKHGANVHAKSNKGKTPLSIASEAGYTNIAEVLKLAGGK